MANRRAYSRHYINSIDVSLNYLEENNMQNRSPIPQENIPSMTNECIASGMSWAAILGGTIIAIAVSLALLVLGSALGLSSFSPWSSSNPDLASFTVKTAIWLIIMQWIASGLGGYITGRLRIKWTDMHTDEVFFRDTAHGFITWSLATVFTACFLASVTTAIINGGAHAAVALSGAAVIAASDTEKGQERVPKNPSNVADYYVDKLLRINPSANAQTPNPSIPYPEVRMETSRILLQTVKEDGISEEDKQYLSQVVASRSGISQADAEKRVDEVISEINTFKAQIQDKTEAARKMSMKVSLYIFLSMLIGAFITSASAALGGRRRDTY